LTAPRLVRFTRAMAGASVRQRAKNFVPSGRDIAVRQLAAQAGLEPPISMQTLLARLEPEKLVFDFGPLGPSTVTGTAHLGLSSDGFWLCRGHVHESGAIGHSYLFTILLGIIDDHALVLPHKGSVAGTVDVGSSDDDWTDQGHSPLIGKHWEELKKGALSARLDVVTDIGQAIETVMLGLGIVGAGVALAVFAGDSRTDCDPAAAGDSQGIGARWSCRMTW
jgi:hypothetical protein